MKKNLREYSFTILAGCLALSLVSVVSFADDATANGQAVPKDNSRINQRDKNPGELTAGHQNNNRSDFETTRQIRRAVTRDKGLSTYAHNVKIITRGGAVTLKGPVRSEAERKSVEQKAIQVAGADHVNCQLEVSPKAE